MGKEYGNNRNIKFLEPSFVKWSPYLLKCYEINLYGKEKKMNVQAIVQELRQLLYLTGDKCILNESITFNFYIHIIIFAKVGKTKEEFVYILLKLDQN